MTADNLTNLLDALTETSVYVIEEDSHCLLYFNRRCKETGRLTPEIGRPCHQVWPEHCDNCPLTALGHGQSSHILSYDPLLETTVDVTADRIIWVQQDICPEPCNCFWGMHYCQPDRGLLCQLPEGCNVDRDSGTR